MSPVRPNIAPRDWPVAVRCRRYTVPRCWLWTSRHRSRLIAFCLFFCVFLSTAYAVAVTRLSVLLLDYAASSLFFIPVVSFFIPPVEFFFLLSPKFSASDTISRFVPFDSASTALPPHSTRTAAHAQPRCLCTKISRAITCESIRGKNSLSSTSGEEICKNCVFE